MIEQAVLAIGIRPDRQRFEGVFARRFRPFGISSEDGEGVRAFGLPEAVIGIHRAAENVRILNRLVGRERGERRHRRFDRCIMNRAGSFEDDGFVGVLEEGRDQRTLQAAQCDRGIATNRHRWIAGFRGDLLRGAGADEAHDAAVTNDRILVVVLREHRAERLEGSHRADLAEAEGGEEADAVFLVPQ